MNIIKKVKILAIIILIAFLPPYLLGAYTSWQLNPAEWEMPIRFLCGLLALAIFCVVSFITIEYSIFKTED
jgi:hypothetical protein